MSTNDTSTQETSGDEGHEKKAAAGLLLRRARKAKTGYDWADRINWIGSLFRSKADMAMLWGSMGVVGVVGGMTALDAIDAKRRAAERPSIVEEERSTETSTVFTIEGWDKAGRRGLFDVVVAKKEFLWVKGSSEEIEKGGAVLKSGDIAGALFDTEVSAAIGSAREIIAVGTASQEGEPEEEKARAGRRAKLTADIATGKIDDKTPVWTLNLGQYREQCAACETSGTSWQRPFIVIAAKELDDDINLAEALSDALSGKTRLPSPTAYSAFEISKVR